MTSDRRSFLAGTAAFAAAMEISNAVAAIDDIPIIDCHIHLFGATRPQGAPYKGSKAFAGGVALPSMYAKIARHSRIVGAIEVEASPWLEDNLWVLETIQPEPIMVGTVGNLRPENRVVFGSDWPNAVGVSELPDTVALVRAYFSGKTRMAAEKIFWKNSIAVYKWIKRAADQPTLS
jgi:predicted TIM-barrel fold metal-dependent hydrolase